MSAGFQVTIPFYRASMQDPTLQELLQANWYTESDDCRPGQAKDALWEEHTFDISHVCTQSKPQQQSYCVCCSGASFLS